MPTPAQPMILSRTVVHRGRKFNVETVQIPGPGGPGTAPLTRDLIVHPGAVVVLAITDDHRVVMIRNRRFSVGKILWELPAGTLEVGEDPQLCAGRELVEETGYSAARITPLCAFYSSPGICTERMYAFAATGLTHVGQDLEDDEQIEVELVPMDRVVEMARTGEIEDGKSIAALLYYRTFARPSP